MENMRKSIDLKKKHHEKNPQTKQSPGHSSSPTKTTDRPFHGVVAVFSLSFFSALLRYKMNNKDYVHLKQEHIMFHPLCFPNNKACKTNAYALI